MKIKLLQLFFVLPQSKLSVNFIDFIFTNVFFKEVIVFLYYMYCIVFGEIHLPTHMLKHRKKPGSY